MLVFPNCKINLGLCVVEKRKDGKHNLETVFYPIPLRDTLEVKPLTHSNESFELITAGSRIEGDPAHNLVVKIYLALQEEFDLPPVSIYLDKHIPMGAGLGGGSSDAAYMMRVLNEQFHLGLSPEDMEQRIAVFGADCPFFIQERPCFATGIGDKMTPLSLSLKSWHIALIKPQESVATKEAYANIIPKAPAMDLRTALQLPVEEWKGKVVNDFEEVVFKIYPQVQAIKETLYDMGAAFALMSGSGSTVFGLFKQSPISLDTVFDDCFTFQSLLRE